MPANDHAEDICSTTAVAHCCNCLYQVCCAAHHVLNWFKLILCKRGKKHKFPVTQKFQGVKIREICQPWTSKKVGRNFLHVSSVGCVLDLASHLGSIAFNFHKQSTKKWGNLIKKQRYHPVVRCLPSTGLISIEGTFLNWLN